MIAGALVLSGIVIALSIALVLCSRLAPPSEDPVVDEVERILPRIQCGQCGYPGCRPYAAAIVAENAPLDLCPPGGEDTVRRLARFLGRAPDDAAIRSADAAAARIPAGAHPAAVWAAEAGSVTMAGRAGSSALRERTGASRTEPAAQAPGGIAAVQAPAAIGCAPTPANMDDVALIDEGLCIGCNLCLRACPVDAIAGVPQMMHTVIAEHCTGCALCLPPCPVDCITLISRHA